MVRSLKDNKTLEWSPTAANCRMNRERELRGTNSYTADLGFDPLEWLLDLLRSQKPVSWLDLCCGSGRALVEAAKCAQQAGIEGQIEILGVDLVDMFLAVPTDVACLTLQTASVHEWEPGRKFDLITCVHGLHYVGDKLGLISRAATWLKPKGRFVTHLDLDNLKLTNGKSFASQLGKHFKRSGFAYDKRRRLLTCNGNRRVEFPYDYVGADDEAGPNFTGQEAVDSYYAEAKGAE